MDVSEAGIGHNNPPEPTIEERLAIEHADLIAQVQQVADKANAVKLVVDDKGLTTDEDLVPMVEVGKAASKLSKLLGQTTLSTTKPLRDEVERIREFFKVLETRVSRISTAFSMKVDEYETAKRQREQREAAERARIAQAEAEKKLQEAEAQEHSVMADVVMNEAALLEREAQVAAHAAVTAGTGPTRTEAGTVSQSKKWAFQIDDATKIPLNELRPYIKIADLEKFVRAYVAANRDTRPLAGVRVFQDTKTSFR